MSAHTPGPWELTDRQHFIDGWDETVGVDNYIIAIVSQAMVRHQPRWTEAAKANARLIAAAPELLAACKSKLEDCRKNGECGDPALMADEYCSSECAALATAVEKAEGSTSSAQNSSHGERPEQGNGPRR